MTASAWQWAKANGWPVVDTEWARSICAAFAHVDTGLHNAYGNWAIGAYELTEDYFIVGEDLDRLTAGGAAVEVNAGGFAALRCTNRVSKRLVDAVHEACDRSPSRWEIITTRGLSAYAVECDFGEAFDDGPILGPLCDVVGYSHEGNVYPVRSFIEVRAWAPIT